MNTLTRAVVTLGVVSLFSALFVFARGDVEIVKMRGGAVAVASALGLLACVAGWLDNRLLILAAGVAFLLAAVALLVLLGARGNGGFLDGSASTFSLWLGLGIGLVTLGLTLEPQGSTA